MPGRSPTQMKGSVQGSEKIKNIAGTGTYTTFFRELDTRNPRWWSVAPLLKWRESPYVAVGGNPILLFDVARDKNDPTQLNLFVIPKNLKKNLPNAEKSK